MSYQFHYDESDEDQVVFGDDNVQVDFEQYQSQAEDGIFENASLQQPMGTSEAMFDDSFDAEISTPAAYTTFTQSESDNYTNLFANQSVDQLIDVSQASHDHQFSTHESHSPYTMFPESELDKYTSSFIYQSPARSLQANACTASQDHPTKTSNLTEDEHIIVRPGYQRGNFDVFSSTIQAGQDLNTKCRKINSLEKEKKKLEALRMSLDPNSVFESTTSIATSTLAAPSPSVIREASPTKQRRVHAVSLTEDELITIRPGYQRGQLAGFESTDQDDSDESNKYEEVKITKDEKQRLISLRSGIQSSFYHNTFSFPALPPTIPTAAESRAKCKRLAKPVPSDGSFPARDKQFGVPCITLSEVELAAIRIGYKMGSLLCFKSTAQISGSKRIETRNKRKVRISLDEFNRLSKYREKNGGKKLSKKWIEKLTDEDRKLVLKKNEEVEDRYREKAENMKDGDENKIEGKEIEEGRSGEGLS